MNRSDVYWAVGLTVLFEVVTCLFRFGLGMQSTRSTNFLGRFTLGFRIHHGYLGSLMLGCVLLLPVNSAVRHWLLRAGAALIASDLIHHFAILWPLTGSPEFDLTYP
jgi:hypothetical protein